MMLAALAVVLVPYALWTVWRSRREAGPWLTSPSTSRSIVAARAAKAAATSLGRIAIYAFLGVFALDLSAAAVRRRRQFVPRTAGDHPQRADRLAAELLAQGLAAGLGALLRRRHLRRHPAQFLQFAAHDDPGDDHLDAARRDQRLRAVEVALPGLGDPVRLHDARRLHAGPDRAPALGVHPRHAAPLQLGLRPHPRPRASRACRSRRCSAATITSTSPTT